MRSKILKIVRFFVLICCFVILQKIDLKADPLFPYSNPDGVIVDYSGYADTDKVHVVSSGFGGYTANSKYDWLYISKDNVHFYHYQDIYFEPDSDIYFRADMYDAEISYNRREAYLELNFDISNRYYTAVKVYQYVEGVESPYLESKCTHDILYRQPDDSGQQASDISDNIHLPSEQTPDVPDDVRLPSEQTPNLSDDVQQSEQMSYLNVDVTDIMVTASGTSSVSKIIVDTNHTGGFLVSSKESWVDVEEFAFDGYFHVKFERNESYTPRTAEIIVSHAEDSLVKTISVKQAGIEPFLDVDKTSVSVYSDGSADGIEQCVQVTTKDTGGYTAAADDGCGWLRISNKPEGEYGDSLSAMTFNSSCSFWISVDENRSGNVRTGKIFVRHESGDICKTVTVTQEGRDLDTLEVSSEYVQFVSSDTGMELIEVYAGDDLQWTVKSATGWIYVMDQNTSSRKSSIRGTGSAGFYIYTKKNKSSRTRDGYVRLSADGFKDIEIYVRQPAREKTSGELLRSLIVSVTKKTMYVGQKSRVRFQYPEGMYASDIRKVQYSSNKKKVASVSKGVIRGKKKGKATISVKVTATDNTTKIFKIKVVVDKRLSASSN